VPRNINIPYLMYLMNWDLPLYPQLVNKMRWKNAIYCSCSTWQNAWKICKPSLYPDNRQNIQIYGYDIKSMLGWSWSMNTCVRFRNSWSVWINRLCYRGISLELQRGWLINNNGEKIKYSIDEVRKIKDIRENYKYRNNLGITISRTCAVRVRTCSSRTSGEFFDELIK